MRYYAECLGHGERQLEFRLHYSLTLLTASWGCSLSINVSEGFKPSEQHLIRRKRWCSPTPHPSSSRIILTPSPSPSLASSSHPPPSTVSPSPTVAPPPATTSSPPHLGAAPISFSTHTLLVGELQIPLDFVSFLILEQTSEQLASLEATNKWTNPELIEFMSMSTMEVIFQPWYFLINLTGY